MGSCFSQEENPKRTSARTAQIAQNVVIPEVTWKVDETWAEQSETFRQMAVESGVDVSTAYQSSMFNRATDWLNKFVKYPLSFAVKHKNKQTSECMKTTR